MSAFLGSIMYVPIQPADNATNSTPKETKKIFHSEGQLTPYASAQGGLLRGRRWSHLKKELFQRAFSTIFPGHRCKVSFGLRFFLLIVPIYAHFSPNPKPGPDSTRELATSRLLYQG